MLGISRKFMVICMIVIIFALFAGSASAAKELQVTSVSNGNQGEVIYVSCNDSENLNAYTVDIQWNPAVMNVTQVTNLQAAKTTLFIASSMPATNTMTVTAAMAQYPLTGDANLFSFVANAKIQDGSSTSVGIARNANLRIAESSVDVKAQYTLINGTFTTADHVAPEVTIVTPTDGATVPQTVNVVANITDAGGVDNSTISVSIGGVTVVPTSVTPIDNGYNVIASRSGVPVGAAAIVVSADDNSGNTGTKTHSVTVAVAGITISSPADGSYSNVTEPVILADFVQVTKSTVKMFIDGTDVTASCDVTGTADGAIGLNYTLYGALPDGVHVIVVNGTSSLDPSEKSATVTFTKDTTPPVVTVVNIQDSDGDGFPEANELLTISYTAVDANLNNVWVDTVTNTSKQSSGIIPITMTYGNKNDMAYASDLAGNVNTSAPFHIYNDYIAYFDDPTLGSFAGLDLTTLSLYDVFENAKVFTLTGPDSQANTPALGQFDKLITGGSNVTLDNRKDDPIPAGSLPDKMNLYTTPSGTLQFQITMPYITNATMLIGRANSSFMAQVLRNPSSSSVNTNNFQEIIDPDNIVLYGKGPATYGYALMSITADGDISIKDQKGQVQATSGNMAKTIRENSYDISSGFNTATAVGIKDDPLSIAELGKGEYIALAVCMDNNRFSVLSGTAFVVEQQPDVLTTDASSYYLGNDIAVTSTITGDSLTAVLLNNDAAYTGNMTLNLTTLSASSLESAYLVADNNQSFFKPSDRANLWVSKGYMGYAGKNSAGTTLSVPTSGLIAGNYRLHMLVENDGNVTSYAEKIITLSAAPPVADFTATPMNGYAPLEVNFTDESTTASDWLWSFGDGNTSTLQNPTHTYVTVGTYTVTLTVSNSAGTDSKTKSITVLDAPPVPPCKTVNLTISDPGTSVSEVGGVQQVAFDPALTQGGIIVGNNIILAKDGINITIMTSGLSPAANELAQNADGFNLDNGAGSVKGTVTGVVLDGAPVTASICPTGNATFSFNASMPRYNSLAKFDVSFYNQTGDATLTKFKAVATSAGKQIDALGYAVYIVKKNLGANDSVSNSYLTFSASETWVNANGGSGAISIMREADNGTCQFISTTYIGSDGLGNMTFRAYSPDGFSAFAMVAVSAIPSPTPAPTPIPGPSGGGGGGGGGGYSGGFGPTVPSYQYTSDGVLNTNTLGQVEGNVEISSVDGGAKLLLSNGVQAFDANGRALSEVSIAQSTAGATPGTSGALYKFGDFVYDCLPAGATFAPSIDIKFELTEAQFNALNPGQTFSVRYYDEGSKTWVEVPTYINPNTREVIGEVTHFTYYALMAVGGTSAPVVPGAEVVPTEQPTTPVEPTEPVAPSEGGMPGWIWVLLIVVIIAVAGAVFYLYKEGKIGGSNS